MLYMNYIKQNLTSILCFSTHVKQNANNAIYLLNHVKHKTSNAFCCYKSKHSALSAMRYLSPIKHCKTKAMLFLKILNPNNAECFLNHLTHKTHSDINQSKNSSVSTVCYLNLLFKKLNTAELAQCFFQLY